MVGFDKYNRAGPGGYYGNKPQPMRQSHDPYGRDYHEPSHHHKPFKPVPLKMPPLKLPPLKGKSPFPKVPWKRLPGAFRGPPFMRPLNLLMEVIDDVPWVKTNPNWREWRPYSFGPEWVKECDIGPAGGPGPPVAFGGCTTQACEMGPPMVLQDDNLNAAGCAKACTQFGAFASTTPIASNTRTVWLGPQCQNGRMWRNQKWQRPFPGTQPIPFNGMLPSPVVQPLPGTGIPPQPTTRTRGYPKPETDGFPAPAGRPLPIPGTKPGSQYVPPYVDGGHPELPGKEKTKWKVPHIKVGDFYGWLTEIKDGLKCFEANLDKRVSTSGKVYSAYRRPKGGGLDDRLIKAATFAVENPDKVDWAGFIECLVYNNIEDKIIGKANQLANRITKSPYWQRPVGVGSGAWIMRV